MVAPIKASDFNNSGSKIPLGYKGEHKVRSVLFDITNFVNDVGPDGTVEIKVLRNGEGLPYNATSVTYPYETEEADKTYVLWTITNVDTGMQGNGQCQLVYTVDNGDDDPIIKTMIYNTMVQPGIGAVGSTPNPSRDIVAEIDAAVTAATEAAETATTKASDAEAYGAGTRGGEPVASDDPSYHNNAAYYEGIASSSAETASTKASDSEAYAVGTRGGEPVSSTDPTYHNNSKYYADYVDEHINDFARIDGYYEDMTVGDAEQLTSTVFVEDNTPYIFRTAGGSADISNRKYESLVGGTVSWNQLLQNGNFANVSIWNAFNCSYTVSGGVATITGTGDSPALTQTLTGKNIAGHVYFVSADAMNSDGASIRITVFRNSNTAISKALTENVWTTLSAVYKPDSIVNAIVSFQRIASDSGDFSLRNCQFFDLTQMFGTNIANFIYSLEQAEAGKGVAFFRKLFPKPYYPYDAGSLQSVKATGIKTRGFNQWDEEWEQGDISTSTGENVASTSVIRSKNYQACIPNTNYYFGSTGSYSICSVRLYDANKNFIKSISNTKNTLFNTGDNCHYFRICAVGTSYNNDICINLSWSGVHNGEYEPYEEHTYDLDSNLELRGIPKLASTDELYYDGDEYLYDGTVRRKYGIVDLGTLNYVANAGSSSSYDFFGSQRALSDCVPGTVNALCYKYITVDALGASAGSDKNIRIDTNNYVRVRDLSYTDADSFKAAMSGVMLVYELAEPTEETATPYAYSMVVNDLGTEEFLDGRTVEVPVGHETKYPANLRDKLQHLPNLGSSDGTYLIHQEGANMTLEKLPDAPSADGAYNLTVSINNGTKSYSWEDSVSKSYQGDLNAENYVISMRKWFKDNYVSGMTDLTQLCERWYDITKTGWAGGTQFSKTSNASTGTRVGDNIGKSCTPSTNSVKGQDSFANIPLFYTVDCNSYIDSEGKPRITAIENVMGDFVRNDPEKIVAAMQMTGWVKYEEDTTSYTYNYADENADGLYKPLPEAVNMDGSVRSFVVHGKYAFGDNWECCSGKKTKLWNVSYASQRTGVHTAWGNQYCGRTSADDSFLKLMTYIKYASLTLDTIMPGCLAYNYQYPAAVSEEGVERIILTTAQANNFVVGSSVIIGNPTAFSSGTTLNLDRNQAGLRAKADRVKITSIEEVEIDGATYAAVNVDNGGVTFDTTPNTITTTGDAPTYISTIAWDTGSTDAVLGFDGSPTNYSSAKEPIKLQGIELLVGAYFVRGDTILEYYKDGTTQCYRERICRDASLLSSSLTSDYKTPSYSLTYDIVSDSWNYIKRIGFDESLPEAMFATELGGSSSTYTRDVIYLLTNATGARECHAFGHLNNGVTAGGLSYVGANDGLSSAYWSISGGLSLTGCRGEYVA